MVRSSARRRTIRMMKHIFLLTFAPVPACPVVRIKLEAKVDAKARS
jgi:hypothetical protein